MFNRHELDIIEEALLELQHQLKTLSRNFRQASSNPNVAFAADEADKKSQQIAAILSRLTAYSDSL